LGKALVLADQRGGEVDVFNQPFLNRRVQ
jgi:hypothetical protein